VSRRGSAAGLIDKNGQIQIRWDFILQS